MDELKILYLEDSEQDAELTQRLLQKAGLKFSVKLVDSRDEYKEALESYSPDIILADHSLFHFNSSEALRIFKEKNKRIPFILVTGTVSEEFAVNILKEGADDYLLKSNLTRLPNAILNSLEKYKLEREREQYMNSIIENESLMKEAETLSHFGSWEANITTGSVKWSDGMFYLLGYEPGEIKPGHDMILYHIQPEDRLIYQNAIYSELVTKDIITSELRMTDKKGQEKVISFKIVTNRDEEGALIRLVGYMQDVTELRQLEKELAEQAIQQQKIITEVTIKAQEKERDELGKELHDNINQVLATVKMLLGMSIQKENKREEFLNRSMKNLNYAIEEIRKLSKTLVAPTLGNTGIAEAINELVDEINFSDSFRVTFDTNLEKDNSLNEDLQLTVYRIVQEQITNIRKYAKASEVAIFLMKEGNSLSLSVKDNGIGFDVEQKAQGIGLKNISSRVNFYSGRMNIISSPGNGCILNINIPFKL